MHKKPARFKGLAKVAQKAIVKPYHRSEGNAHLLLSRQRLFSTYDGSVYEGSGRSNLLASGGADERPQKNCR